MTTTSGTFTLYLSTDPIDEPIKFEVEVTAEITEAIPERGPSYACGGEPAVEGRAEITVLDFDRKCGTSHFLFGASWLLDIIPQATLDRWAATLYEDYSPADDRADWERDQDVMNKRFDMLGGEAAECKRN